MAPPGPSVIFCGAPVRFHQIKMLDDTTWNSRPSRTGLLFEDNITTRIWNGVGVATFAAKRDWSNSAEKFRR